MSAQTVPRQAYHRLPDGKYEVFVEEVSGRNNRHFFWASRTDSAVIIDTLPFDAVPAEMEFGKKDKRKRCKVFPAPGSPLLLVRRSLPAFPKMVLNSPTMFNVYYASAICLRTQRSISFL
jgi:hypothetical protein